MSDRWLVTKTGACLFPGEDLCVLLPLWYPSNRRYRVADKKLGYVASQRRYTHWLNGGPP